MFFAILFYPLISAICCGFFGWALGYYGVCLLGVFCVGTSFIYSMILFYKVAITGDVLTLELWPWFETGFLNLSWGFLYDSLTAIMFLVVTFISLLVHIYSTGYMKNDPHFARFMGYLSLFTFFMLILVSADNFIQLFLGWEGVGLCSYLLISFWYTRIQANKAAIKALIVNRIGDFAIIIALSLIFLLYKSLKYAVIFCLTPHVTLIATITFGTLKFPLITIICFFLFIGAVGKSAQIGLHTWLPDAMEGPTPVSALIHAATMVTAGVFLIIRCSPLFEYAPTILTLLLFFGAFTCFFASTVGLVQHDLKKIIAYSTCSQLGYMIFVCGFSNYNLSLYHLTTHACFKALLFLCAGSVIHAVLDEQDMRRMGGLKQLLPLTYVCMLIGSFALIGFPFLAGFYSKDLIIESAAGSIVFGSTFVYWLSSLSAILTSVYSTRLLFYTFLDQPNGAKQIFSQVHESGWSMLGPLCVLSILSIFLGFYGQDLFAGLGTPFFGNAIFILPQAFHGIEIEFFPWYIKIIPICFSLLGFSLTLFMYFVNINFLYSLKIFSFKIFYFLSKKWYFDIIYNKIIVYSIFQYSFFGIYKNLDKGFLELFGPQGIKGLLLKFSDFCRHLHTAILYQYLCFMLLAIFFLVFFFF